jgi:CheY-like chemotaxis protein
VAPDCILIVDDDEAIRETLAQVLAEEGFGVDASANGREALAWLRAHAGGSTVLVLLDLMMPIMDGRAFLREKEGDPSLSSVPVVVITAGGGCAQLRRLYQIAGCLGKPISVPRLLAIVNSAAMPPSGSP